ncbi:MAG: helix-turn-helix transcriptional regulator [Clostridia bacterium]|nr:helix-turn-helix transcriptional regulator [Clostridia bacterium]
METKSYSKYFDSKISYNHLCYYNPDWHEVIPQIHDGFEIIFVTKGNLRYITNKKTYDVSENSIILTRPGDYHMLNLHNRDIYERYNIIFDEKIVMNSVMKKLPPETDIIIPKNSDFFLSLFEKFDLYCRSFEGEELSKIISHLVEEVFFNIVHISKNPDNNIRTMTVAANPILDSVTEYIEKHIAENFTVESMCNELYISKSYLLKLFNSHIQIPPKQYIVSRRMIHAQNLLRLGNKPTEVLSLCGFTDYSAFYRNYKTFFGYSPSEEVHMKKIRRIEY